MLRALAFLLTMWSAVACGVQGVERSGSDTQNKMTTSAPPVRSSISIATFNIRYANSADGVDAWQFRRREVLERLQQGDVWGLQEALPAQVSDIERGRPDLEVVARTRESDPTKGEACPILFQRDRWMIDGAEQGTFWLSETPDVAGSKSWDSSLPRIATFARLIERSDGLSIRQQPRALYVFNVHLDHQGTKAREEQVKVVLARIASRKHLEDPVVLLGDFNAGPESAPIAAVREAEGMAWLDAWRVANPEAHEQGTFNGWGDSCGTRRIDFIFASGLEVERAWIDFARRTNGRWLSDHVPVCAQLRFPKEAAPALSLE